VVPGLGEQSPSLSSGNVTLPDGSTLDVREKPGKSPFDKLREWVGLIYYPGTKEDHVGRIANP
jgi:hypothetical protein